MNSNSNVRGTRQRIDPSKAPAALAVAGAGLMGDIAVGRLSEDQIIDLATELAVDMAIADDSCDLDPAVVEAAEANALATMRHGIMPGAPIGPTF